MAGLWDRLNPSGTQTKYIVVGRTEDMEPVKTKEVLPEDGRIFYEEPMTKDAWEQEYYEQLEPGTTYYCVETTAQGYTLEDPEWTLTVEDDTSEESRKIDKLERKVDDLLENAAAGSVDDLNLTHVDDADEVEAKITGAVAQQGLSQASDVDDVVRILNAVKETNQQQNPLGQLLGGLDNQLKVQSMSDLAMLTMLPQLQSGLTQGITAVRNVNQALEGGSGLAGLLGGSQSNEPAEPDEDVVQLRRDEFEQLRAAARENRAPDAGGQPADVVADDAGEEEEASFSMDAFVDEPDEPTPADAPPETEGESQPAAPPESDDGEDDASDDDDAESADDAAAAPDAPTDEPTPQ